MSESDCVWWRNLMALATRHPIMNLTTLRYLVSLHQHQHFGRAAQACHITQPALSNALRALEEEFGATIVKRGRSYAGLTVEGERILASAQRILNERDSLQQDLDSSAAQPRGGIRLGAVPTAIPIIARFAAILHTRFPGIAPMVRSMSSPEIEAGLENLSLDMGLGYSDRLSQQRLRIATLAQYTEHYFLLRRASEPHPEQLAIGEPTAWRDAADMPLCLLTPEMHNRSIIDGAFAMAGVQVRPAIETNSILTLAVSVAVGSVSSILPGALVAAVRGYRELEALPLVHPTVETPIGFMFSDHDRPSRTVQAALALASELPWLEMAALQSGPLI